MVPDFAICPIDELLLKSVKKNIRFLLSIIEFYRFGVHCDVFRVQGCASEADWR